VGFKGLNASYGRFIFQIDSAISSNRAIMPKIDGS
jgi:hypothetical protein